MRDAIHSIGAGAHDWKQRVADFAASEVFDRLFKDGMKLVEEAAAYLDGPGRQASRSLPREGALVYAAESMEVTTRLMQAASWLVVQRAVRDKDMTLDEAGEQKFRLAPPTSVRSTERVLMPAELRVLIDRSRALYDRVWRLDEALYCEDPLIGDNPVIRQLDKLKSAAEGGVFDPLAIWREQT
ncbi:DUF1465 family protein [bacterium]|nr:DUF1465 family protein [bacterium]